MSATLIGNGLGLFDTSLSLLNNSFGQAALGQTGERSYVNGYSGNLVVQNRDQLLVGLGIDAALIRTYNSQGQLDGDNNDNWRLGVASLKSVVGTVNTAGSSITKINVDGSETVFVYNTSSGKYRSTAGSGAHDFIALNGDGTAVSYRDNDTGNVEFFAADGSLYKQQDRDGNETFFSYILSNDGTRLLKQASNSGQNLNFTYDLSNKQLLNSSIDTLDDLGNVLSLQQVSYGYDVNGRLDRVTVDLTPENTTDNVKYETTYSYDGSSNRLAGITQSDGTSISFGYINDAGTIKIKTVTDGVGNVTTGVFQESCRLKI